jgi:alkanesulfonate monooxygenase SsuD/methylene tetrahydromethanopterin reductase-like flavin-dependent oxidoreductase (luciferase family)
MKHLSDTIRAGLHSGPVNTTYAQYLDLWQRAEALGFQWASLFDHFRPPDFPDGPCFEGSTLLAAMAAGTKKLSCGMLVFGIANRHPAMVANIASTIDHISGGRLELGLGAGAPDFAQQQYGFLFPPVGVRMEMLDEYCQVLDSLLYKEQTTFQGKYYHLEKAQVIPRPVQSRIPLIIGGAGEKRTLDLVARHADIWNTFTAGNIGEYRHKSSVLGDFCATHNRPVEEIRKSILFRAIIFDDDREKQNTLQSFYNGLSAEDLATRGYLSVGSAEQCIEALIPYLEMGVRDFLFGVKIPTDWRSAELFIQKVIPALRACKVHQIL